MSKASRLTRPPSKLPSPRKECPATASRSRVGEKLMRAGSDGTVNRQKSLTVAAPMDKGQSENEIQASSQEERREDMTLPKSKISPPKVSSQHGGTAHKQSKSNLKVTSLDDSEQVSRRQPSPNGTHTSTRDRDAKSSRTVPRRHTLGGARGSKEILAMQPSDMDKKREAFLEHLKHKYPHHASAIMGHQERLREHSRSPKHGPSPQPGAGDQVDHISLASLDSLEAMSEGDTPSTFTRGSRVRASLPVVRSTNQTKDRSLGVLYLQYGDETKQIRMPNEVTSIDTVRALFVSAFPQQLTMKMLESPSMAVYVKDDMRNVYYELSDVRNITDHSCLKVYHKDPAQAFNHGARPANGDARMHGDMVHPGPHPLRQPPIGPPPHHPMQGALPPTPHSMPPSPSRIPFGPRQSSLPSSATMPRERLSNASATVRSVSPCPSAILERRDVKPDEDMPNKSHTLTRGSEGIYADPYMLANAHGPHPSPGLDGPEHDMRAFHRASIRSTGSYSGPSPTDTIDHPSLYRQKSRNSQLPTLGSKTPPPSPHRMAEVRMIDIHGPPHGIPPHAIPPHGMPPHGVPPHGVPPHGVPPHGVPPHGVPMERGSPVRQSFRKDDGAGSKARANMGSPVITEVPGHPQGPIPAANDKQTRERMKAMEQQIASLTGLVQHALLKGPNTSGTKESISERPPKTSSPAHSVHSSSGSPVLAPKTPTIPTDKAPIKVNLLQFRKNVSDLRMQLHQMRQLQLQNQEALRLQLKKAEQEISVKLSEAMQRADDPVQKQRTMVEEDRHKYLTLEERVLTQLSELEQYVGSLQKDSSGTQRTVTLKDVEEGAVTLRKVGESLAGLKGEFPALQTRMRAVLRVEVEAVKFLKEEPHKLDTMLKRVKMLTDILSGLRKSASENPQKTPVVASNPADSSPLPAETPTQPPPISAPPSSTPPPASEPQSPTIKSEVMPSSPVVIQQVQSSMVLIQQSQQSAALTTQPGPPLNTSPANSPSPTQSKRQGRESPKGVSVDPPIHKKTNGNPASNGNGTFHKDMVIEELQKNPDKSKNRALSIKAAEKEWEERRQNMGHYDGKEFEKILQEAQANMMKGIPNLEVEEKQTIHPAALVEQPTSPNTVESPTELKPENHTEKSGKKAPEKLPKPAKPTLERSSRVNSEESPVMKQSSKDNSTKTGSEKANKSPPPPPPRKTFSSPTSGMTTTRTGEVVFTRKDSTSTPEVEEEPPPPPSPQPRSPKVPPETKPKPSTPPPATPPVTPPAPKEEEDEGDKIMAELQVFQKCSNKDTEVKNVIEPTPRIEPQIRELRTGTILPLKDKKTTEPKREEKDPETDENGNTTLRQSQGVIYYVTGQIPKEPPPPPTGQEDAPEPPREPLPPPSQVSNVNVNSGSSEQQQQQQQQQQQPKQPKSPTSPPPISPKPVGLNGFKLPRKNMRRSESMKTSSEMEKGNMRNKINNEKKKEKFVQEHKPIITESLTVVKSDKEITTKVVKAAPPKGNFAEINEEASLSPDLPGEEAPPPPDNIAFKITNSKVQALSNGEYQELVNAKKGSVQTVTVGNAVSKPLSPVDSNAPQDNGFNKKPVIIIFDEPMDIRSAYKRLSTIFECEEELERMLAEETIEEESEESDSEKRGGQQAKAGDVVDGKKSKSGTDQSLSSSSSSSISEISDSTGNLESSGDGKDSKKKFKFKFPKKQLAALTQAIRTGTKSGKKTLQVVVYEDEEESDGTVRQHKEAKRFEISRSKSLAERSSSGVPQLKKQNSDSQCRTDEIRKNTYKTLDSLEQTIKQLETTISEMGPLSPDDTVNVEDSNGKGKKSDANLKRSTSLPASRGPGPKVLKSALKKPKVLPRPVVTPTTNTASTTASTTTTTTTTSSSDPSAPSAPCSIQQNASVASPTSRMPVPLSAKSRQSSAEKAGKQQKLQDAQRQFRQANGSAKRVGGDHKTTSQTVPVSKIPAFYPSSTKGSSQCAPDHATNSTNSISSSSSSTVTITKSSMLPARSSSLPHPTSHIPSLSNGSLKLSSSQHTGKSLSFSMQNGRVHPSSSSSSSSSPASTPSPLSPTPLGPGGKSIRTIHTPSFNSYRAHNGSSSGKSCIPTAAKDTA
ncbi:sickle tail protein isoform X19 [Periophthalmus magnuspinnatus]|uniref:sickle tail protein isoform X19 n=1 Tax=Periophthalmus magnuspinnatus TaxID=409849 RepID=UPI00243687EA|nr:sickle tail protein isoform X19 [Periophthalmus magnuspinnatus]